MERIDPKIFQRLGIYISGAELDLIKQRDCHQEQRINDDDRDKDHHNARGYPFERLVSQKLFPVPLQPEIRHQLIPLFGGGSDSFARQCDWSGTLAQWVARLPSPYWLGVGAVAVASSSPSAGYCHPDRALTPGPAVAA